MKKYSKKNESVYCDICKKKYRVLKLLNLLKSPRISVLVLKRIKYNNVTKENYKINDYLEFPFKLDNEKSNKDNFILNLLGLIIHRGDASFAHYYSIIIDNEEN